MKRRQFLQVGLGALGMAALPLRLEQAAAASPARKRCIFLFMAGGPCALDTFDPKPDLPNASAALASSVAGIELGARLPQLAERAHHLAIVRSLASGEGNHQRARHLMLTGHASAAGVEHPAFGALVASERQASALPGFIEIGEPGPGPGFLGPAQAPFQVPDARRGAENLAPAGGLAAARVADREQLWRSLERDFARQHDDSVVTAHRTAHERAIALARAAEAAAFDIDVEPLEVRSRYGDNKFGRGCLMARRLIEAGATFVTVTQSGWDTHTDHQARTQPLLGELDLGFSALLDDLSARGQLESTLLVWAGEFGRTPHLNARGGRDHYPKVTPLVLAGGGVRGGIALGATTADGSNVVGSPASVADVYASVAASLGIDGDRRRMSRAGRPISAVDSGQVLPELFAPRG